MYSLALLALTALAATAAFTYPVRDERRSQIRRQDFGQQYPTPVGGDYDSDYVPENEEEGMQHHFQQRMVEAVTPTAPTVDELAEKEWAKLSVLERLLAALGKDFHRELPRGLTNDTLATVPTDINITSEDCSDKYMRCSSQAFFASCDIPRNTDPEIWPQHFNLYFNLSTDFESEVINATLRLFKNNSPPLQYQKTLLVSAYVYTKSLTRKRSKKTKVDVTEVPSDYVGYVLLTVDKMAKRWKRQKNNHGLLITVSDVDETPWDASRLFVTMDCNSSNVSLVPLPFEVQTDDEDQRFPAISLVLGTPQDEGEANPPSPRPLPVVLPEGVTMDVQSENSNNYLLGSEYPLGIDYPLVTNHHSSTSQTHHHPNPGNYDTDILHEDCHDEVESEINPRFHGTQETLTGNSRGGSVFERGWSGERGSSGESWSQPTPASEEARSQRQRGATKERRHRKKHRQHHRRGLERRNSHV
ncbi:hypothetical protein OTU49_002306 [Cherax quadricarinatus]|uniref:Uncharacterized protein n=1 Tax=Cherax quadricarinatus TaxID=27406 RepID=A0AAW0XQP1_CHEQU|nr:uncharacterized protein LOC128692671 isoform X2 [Cherax quadricarinatus]